MTNISKSFYLQDGGKNQLAAKLRRCHPMYPVCAGNYSQLDLSGNGSSETVYDEGDQNQAVGWIGGFDLRRHTLSLTNRFRIGQAGYSYLHTQVT